MVRVLYELLHYLVMLNQRGNANLQELNVSCEVHDTSSLVKYVVHKAKEETCLKEVKVERVLLNILKEQHQCRYYEVRIEWPNLFIPKYD